jgi:hypothetical protein
MSKKVQDKPIEIHKYKVSIQALVPVDLVYKVEAENAEEALKMVEERFLADKPKIKFKMMKVMKAKICKWGSLLIELTK